jgi:hypothetical protein
LSRRRFYKTFTVGRDAARVFDGEQTFVRLARTLAFSKAISERFKADEALAEDWKETNDGEPRLVAVLVA